jgi:hypothetical protein
VWVQEVEREQMRGYPGNGGREGMNNRGAE